MDHESRIIFRRDITKQLEVLSERIDTQGERINKNIDETSKQNNKLESVEKIVNEVDEKLKFTNGKIANAMMQIKALESKNEADKETDEELRQLISIKIFVEKYLFNKYFAGFIFIFVFGALKVISDERAREVFLKIFWTG